MLQKENITIPRWFLERIEDTLRIQNNINLDKKTGETCQDRNVKESLNGVRKLLRDEELTGGERLERLQPPLIPSGDDHPVVDLERDAVQFCFDKGLNVTPYQAKTIANHFAKWGAEHTPLPEDTVLFQKGVEEGRRLEMEDIMKDAVEKTVGQLERQWGGNIHFMHGFEVDEMDFPFLNSQECGYGDKVRIIIVKEK